MPAAPEPPGVTPPSKPTINWASIKGRAAMAANIVGLFVFLIGIGSAVGYFYAQSKKQPSQTKTPAIQTLSQEDLNKLNEVGANLGTSGQVLNIGANALFRGKADVTGDLSIGGRLNANGPVTLSQLNITGATAATGLNVGSNLIVSGTTTLQKSLTVNDLVTINSGLNVAGSASMNSLNATSIAVRSLSISGPLTISHIATQGPTPTIVGGSLGGGGTISISGNDTAGTVNLNTGTSPSAGILGSITFRAGYTATVHVIISPISGAAASSAVYVTRTSTGFQLRSDATPPAGSTISFDYLVTQ